MVKKKSFPVVLFMLIIALTTVTSCQKSLEKQAKKQLKVTMREILKNPDSATLTNVRTVYDTDSICIIDFDCKAQNGFGGYTSSAMEYIYLMDDEDSITHKKIFRESIGTIGSDDDDDFKDYTINSAENTLKDVQSMLKGNDKNKIKRDGVIKITALMRCMVKGREIKEEGKGDDIKL